MNKLLTPKSAAAVTAFTGILLVTLVTFFPNLSILPGIFLSTTGTLMYLGLSFWDIFELKDRILTLFDENMTYLTESRQEMHSDNLKTKEALVQEVKELKEATLSRMNDIEKKHQDLIIAKTWAKV